MCVVCTDWLKGKMTSEEALRALGEFIQSNDEYNEENIHYFEAADKILDKEIEFNDTNPDLDKAWQDDKD